ncbi:MAG: GNAT family N-acetyltransferase [Acetobacter sp.]|nr:GNAT family N-acetyltransferase [Bacteroides sp.]MCM1340576.1 GNAT family N-acetyltransferase [Acetobacter sp.]MCM1433316.1 GNAT family N-acetyltransferase [Clostridiales bacterium]
MIKIIENGAELNKLCTNDLFEIRIKSLLMAYDTKYDFARFYCQYDNNFNVTAIISKLDGDYTVSHNNNCDFSEIEEFIRVLGYTSVLSDDKFVYNGSFEEGIIMSCNKKAEIPLENCSIDEYPKLMDLFNLDDYEEADFENWYVDVNHRIRHNCAKAYSVNVKNEIVSSAMLSSIYNDSAILSSVKTYPEFRRMGYASKLVNYMLNDVKGTVYLMRNQNKNEEFYSKLGFKNIGKWRMYK